MVIPLYIDGKKHSNLDPKTAGEFLNFDTILGTSVFSITKDYVLITGECEDPENFNQHNFSLEIHV